MSYKQVILFLILCSVLLNAQTTFYIKYPEPLSATELQQRLGTNQGLQAIQKSAGNKAVTAVPLFTKRLTDDPGLLSIYVVTSPVPVNALQLDAIRSADPRIEYTQLMPVYKTDGWTNDSLAGQQWALSRIDAFGAWDYTTGSDTVTVGVIDTGVDYLHPDLANKLYINAGETGTDARGKDKRSNGIDDDNNGFTDDYMGWDFTDRVGFPYDSTGGDYLGWDNDPLDQNIYSHGTACSGIIGAETNNNRGIAGVAPLVRVMNLRAFDPDGFGEEDDVAAAILYAVRMGVKVINMSFGDYSFSYVLRDVLRYAYSRGVVLVASAGNSGSPNPHYPSGYSEVISVGNSTIDDYVASTSNYGSTLDLVAPGTDILTTARRGFYTGFSGTSAAAPFVSAAAGLVLSRGNFTNEEVKQIIKTTADDLGQPGWDLRSGAGRLNLKKAVSILSAANVGFRYPHQDLATKNDTLQVIATVLSPYFKAARLEYGRGLNPTAWTSLAALQNQVSNTLIATVPLTGMPDTVYTLRLSVDQTNGRTLEERVNFYKETKAPTAYLVSLIPAYYGNRPTIVAAMETKTPCITRMYYKKRNEAEFRFITLDGFATNNQFVKRLHYGFIPKELCEFATEYDAYFEAENLVGLKTVIKPQSGYFSVTTASVFALANIADAGMRLGSGLLYDRPVAYGSADTTELLINDFNNAAMTYIYRYQSGGFIKADSIKERIPKDFGDFDKNGKNDLLANWGRSLYVLEQSAAGSTILQDKLKREGSDAWPATARDIDGDGRTEIITVSSDSSLTVYRIGSTGALSFVATLKNYSPVGFGEGRFDYPSVAVADFDLDGKNEIWAVDTDGDLVSYRVNSPTSITADTTRKLYTGFYSSSSSLAAGDFNGDSKPDLAILLHSVSELDIAMFNRLLIITWNGNKPDTLFDYAFVDPGAEFSVFTKKTYNSLKFINLNRSGGSELVLCAFPYAYVFSFAAPGNGVVFYRENVNSNSVFSADLNKNGLAEFAISEETGTRFYEWRTGNAPAIPFNVTGYSNMDSSITLTWYGSAPKYHVYMGTNGSQFSLIDSTYGNTFITLPPLRALGQQYYFGIMAIDSSVTPVVSELSKPVAIFHHKPASFREAKAQNASQIIVLFTGQVSTAIADLTAFSVRASNGTVYTPQSAAPLDQFSYLLSFRQPLPAGTCTVTVSGLRDLYGSPMAPGSGIISISPEATPQAFYLTRYQILSPYRIKLWFNQPVDTLSAEKESNYIFIPANAAASAVIAPGEPDAVVLDLSGNKPIGSIGIEYRLQLQGITSSTSTGKLPLNPNSGSIAVLAAYSTGLDEVYFYPSPARLKGGGGTLTFANLPQRAEIQIWTLSGERMVTLTENDGNGGLQWNLRDSAGRQLSSGVYLCRIVMQDGAGNETASKLLKISVVQ